MIFPKSTTSSSRSFDAELGVVVEWSKISREDYLLVMERSPIKDTELKLLLQGALSDEVESESVFMRGIDASYAYEGYEMYRLEELEVPLA